LIEVRNIGGDRDTISKIWRSSEVPGGLVRLDATVAGDPDTKAHAEVIAFDVR
jgi:hypothetical protein